MIVSFGKHRGKLVEALVLKEPSYVLWMLGVRDAFGGLATIRNEAIRLIRHLDSKPFTDTCCSSACEQIATRLSGYLGSPLLRPWCTDCNPSSHGASRDKLSIIETYCDATNHILTYTRRREDLKTIVRCLAGAKGLPNRVGEQQALEFFR